MLRRQVTGSASFVCLRCRLQLAGAAGPGFLSASDAGARVANRSQRYFGSRSVSSLSALSRHTALPSSDPRPQSRCYATDSSSGPKKKSENEPEITTENFFEVEVEETKNSKKDQQIREPAPWELDSAEEGQTRSQAPSREENQDENREEGQRLWEEDQVGGRRGNEFKRAPKPQRWGNYTKPGDWVVRENLYWPLSHFKERPKTWKSRGHHVEATRETLGLDMLGKPAAAIVLRPINPIRPRHVFKMGEVQPGQTSAVLQRLLDGGDNILTSERILLNIHELQPVEERVFSESDFVALRDTLIQGFTVAQLTSYIETWGSALEFKDEGDPKTLNPPWVLDIRPWIPAIESSPPDLDPKLLGYVAPGASPKEKLAVRLMRMCWDLSCHSVLEGQGYLDVKLRKMEFDLLTLGGKRWLNDISRTLLKDGKQIEMFRNSHYISIMAPKYTADLILDHINQVLSRIRTVQFSASYISSEPLEIEPAILNQVEIMTSSLVRRSPSGDKFLVTWIELPNRDEVTENTGEQVLRLLSYAYRADHRASQALLETPDAPSTARYLPEVDCKPKLPWHERSKTWARWTAAADLASRGPISKDGLSPPRSIPTTRNSTWSTASLIPTDIFAHPVEFKDRNKPLPVNATNYGPGWSRNPKTDTTAIFGHVLFSPDSPTSATPPTSTLPRSFAPVLPCVRFLSLESNLKNPGLWHMITVLRFIPAPDADPALIRTAPNLELRFEADHHQIKAIQDLRAVINDYDGDLPLPDSPSDVRLHQTQYYDLPGTGIWKYAEPMFEFLRDSILKPWEGKLSTPPNLDGLRLPKRLFSGEQKEGEEGEEIEMDYMFAGLEIHRTITSEWGGFRLRYTNISGGLRRGQRSEIALDAVRVELPENGDVVKEESTGEIKEEEEEGERIIPAEKVVEDIPEGMDLVEAIDDVLALAEPFENPKEKDEEQLTKEFLEVVGKIARGEGLVGKDGKVEREGLKWFGDWMAEWNTKT
ncbi:mitochondrial inner-membrane-bound regulator-domain-containing protein [Apiosordaria backusii]|uniref:Mitochondrial inner-membrane-bound regulator-domain-containing protein n=1 Tax=Apiosordaria backusii TaxID=314023 RepID=A0AA40E1Q5_9PEZI|nr:mitochondrial inner-membrane-bound regulator-domain-containing protein [Apiosordaria backusii]